MRGFHAYFVVSAERAVGQTVELSEIWDVMTLVDVVIMIYAMLKWDIVFHRRVTIFEFADSNVNILGP